MGAVREGHAPYLCGHRYCVGDQEEWRCLCQNGGNPQEAWRFGLEDHQGGQRPITDLCSRWACVGKRYIQPCADIQRYVGVRDELPYHMELKAACI